MTPRAWLSPGYVPARLGAGSDAAGEAMGAPGSAVPASPASHRLPCQVAHYHLTRDERLACEAEHRTVMARLAGA